MATPIDLAYYLLPALERVRQRSDGKFVNSHEILSALTESLPTETPKLMLPTTLVDRALAKLCDSKQGWDSLVWRLNDDLVMAYLERRFERVAAVQSKDAALQLLSEYVSTDLIDKLSAKLGLVSPHRRDESKTNDLGEKEIPMQQRTTSSSTAPPAAKRAKTVTLAKGQQTMTSFFKKVG